MRNNLIFSFLVSNDLHIANVLGILRSKELLFHVDENNGYYLVCGTIIGHQTIDRQILQIVVNMGIGLEEIDVTGQL